MMFVFQIDGSTVPVYNKPRIQLASRDNYAIFQYTARSVSLSILDTVAITSASRLKIYQNSVATANMIWTGDIDWNSRKVDSKSNLTQITFLPDQAKLKTTDISQTFTGKDFEDVLDHIVSELGTGWSWETTIYLPQIYTYEEEDLDDSYEPNPHSFGAELDVPEPFFTKAGSDPFVKFWNENTDEWLYSKMWRGEFGVGKSSIIGYSRLDMPADVITPISGDVGYGFEYTDSSYYLDHHIYYLGGAGVKSYGPQNLIINQFTVTYASGADVIIKDICQLADAYFYVLDKKIYLIHRHEASEVTITGSVISRKTSYSEVDLTISLSLDYGIIQARLDYLDDYYAAHYSSNRTLQNLVVINPSGRVLPGDTLILNGTKTGTVKGVSYGHDRVNIDVDRLGLD